MFSSIHKVILLSLALLYGDGSCVKLHVTTQYHDGIIPNAFQLRCVPDNTLDCAMRIVAIHLSKDGERNIVSLQGNSLYYDPLMKSSIEAEGHIDIDLTKTYLSVTVNQAVKEDSGQYTCKVLYLDASLDYKVETVSHNVTTNGQNTQDLIKHLLSKVSLLENIVKFQQEEISTLKTSMVENEAQMTKLNQTNAQVTSSLSQLDDNMRMQEHTIDSLIAKDAQVTSSLSQLDDNMRMQEHTIDSLIAKGNTSVYFTALHTPWGVFQDGKDLVYSVVKENVGGGYDGNTGVFTAPVVGFYYFQLSLCPHGKKWIDVDIKSNTRGILARLAAYDSAYQDFGDTSVIVKLGKEETVWPVTRHAHSGLTLWGRGNSDYLNRFSGYLLNAV